jgi:hypothetical protein
MKEQFVVSHTIRQTEITALLGSWVTDAPVKTLCPQSAAYPYTWVNTYGKDK